MSTKGNSEVKIAGAYFQATPGNKWLAASDLVWSLMNSAEFLCRH